MYVEELSMQKLKQYLSPRLRSMMDNMDTIDFQLSIINSSLRRGLVSPLALQKIMTMMDGLMSDTLAIIKSNVEDKDKIKDVDNQFKSLRKRLDEARELIVQAYVVTSPRTVMQKITLYVNQITETMNIFLKPIFVQMSNEMILNPQEFWSGIEKRFVDNAMLRMGIIPEKKEEEDKKGGLVRA